MQRERRTILREKIMESFRSVLPIALIVCVLSFTILPIPADMMLIYIASVVLLTVGMGIFTLGVDLSMTPVGGLIGSEITGTRKLWLIVFFSFLLGTIVTISEPDLTVLAEQVSAVPNLVIILAVAVGVGLFLVIAILRILFKMKLSYMLILCYLVVFVLVWFVPTQFRAVAFDSGGVTTGPMTVPFIMAFGVGISSIRSDKEAENDSFGLVALCSVGPILSVMILGMFFRPDGAATSETELLAAKTTGEVTGLILHALPTYLLEVLKALAPIIAFFLLFQLFFMKLKKDDVCRILVGFLYTFVGLVLFLCAANVGFMSVGNVIGTKLGSLGNGWLAVPIGMLVGYYIVKAEPAVHILNKQVYEMTSGSIPAGALTVSLSIGVAVSIGLSMIRILTDISIMYFLVPGYIIALGLTFFVPPIFTAIAFDSGGVASGSMTATFLLPLSMGVCVGCGGDAAGGAFGVVAMVAMTPLITIQLLGLAYRIKEKKLLAEMASGAFDIIELDVSVYSTEDAQEIPSISTDIQGGEA